jgi:hypothetical protein
LALEGSDELYDLKNDPFEMKNLIDYPAAKQELAALKQELETDGRQICGLME